MNVSGINFESIADGDGVRVVVYIGMCDGCRWKQEKHAWTKE